MGCTEASIPVVCRSYDCVHILILTSDGLTVSSAVVESSSLSSKVMGKERGQVQRHGFPNPQVTWLEEYQAVTGKEGRVPSQPGVVWREGLSQSRVARALGKEQHVLGPEAEKETQEKGKHLRCG